MVHASTVTIMMSSAKQDEETPEAEEKIMEQERKHVEAEVC